MKRRINKWISNMRENREMLLIHFPTDRIGSIFVFSLFQSSRAPIKTSFPNKAPFSILNFISANSTGRILPFCPRTVKSCCSSILFQSPQYKTNFITRAVIQKLNSGFPQRAFSFFKRGYYTFGWDLLEKRNILKK